MYVGGEPTRCVDMFTYPSKIEREQVRAGQMKESSQAPGFLPGIIQTGAGGLAWPTVAYLSKMCRTGILIEGGEGTEVLDTRISQSLLCKDVFPIFLGTMWCFVICWKMPHGQCHAEHLYSICKLHELCKMLHKPQNLSQDKTAGST
jgi:hypothetical protein